MKALLLGNGEPPSAELFRREAEGALVICADGAAEFALEHGVWPAMAVGDFDSLDADILTRLRERGVQIETHPAEKDDTDMQLAAERALKLGAEHIVMLGCGGKRLDHTLGNMQVLAFLREAGVKAEMIDDYCVTRLVKDERTEIAGETGGEFSLVPMGENVIIREMSGVKYPLSDYRLVQTRPLGISNVLLGEKAVLEVEGCVAVIMVNAFEVPEETIRLRKKLELAEESYIAADPSFTLEESRERLAKIFDGRTDYPKHMMDLEP